MFEYATSDSCRYTSCHLTLRCWMLSVVLVLQSSLFDSVFFFNDTATTEIYTYLHTLSLHDALPILVNVAGLQHGCGGQRTQLGQRRGRSEEHTSELQSLMRISYAVFCLKKKKTKKTQT